jgi:hypothetical protein
MTTAIPPTFARLAAQQCNAESVPDSEVTMIQIAAGLRVSCRNLVRAPRSDRERACRGSAHDA